MQCCSSPVQPLKSAAAFVDTVGAPIPDTLLMALDSLIQQVNGIGRLEQFGARILVDEGYDLVQVVRDPARALEHTDDIAVVIGDGEFAEGA